MPASTELRPAMPTAGAAATSFGYVPALDGLRAVAVAAVVVFHAGASWLGGGFLGVSVFFTLSGFLITSLLLDERRHRDRTDLRRFWSRRFRRLLPAAWFTIALVVLLGLLGVWDDAQRRGLGGDTRWAVAELVNWHFVIQGSDYAAASSAPSPLQHLWSLAVEEQFYVLLPLVVVGAFAFARRRATGARAPHVVLGVVLATGIVASSAASARFAGSDVNRAYFGTDSRVAEMLLGALLAVWYDRSRTIAASPSAPAGVASRVVGSPRLAIPAALGLVAASALGVLLVVADVEDRLLYPWGLLACALSTAALIYACLRSPAFSAVLSRPTLVRIGRISYGIYLLHWPVVLALTPERVGFGGVGLAVLRIAVPVAGASALYLLVEQPIRHGHRLRGRAVVPTAAIAVVAIVGGGALVAARATLPHYLEPRALGDLRVQEAPDPTGTSTSAPSTSTAEAPGAQAPTTAPAPEQSPTAAPGGDASSAPPRRAQRVLLVGDSVAASLEGQLLAALRSAGVSAASAAAPGCGVITGFPADEDGRIAEMTRQCNGIIPKRQSDAVARFRPDLVVVLSSWEITNRSVDGVSYRQGTPEMDALLRRLYGETIDRLSATGAAVALTLMPDAVDGTTQQVGPEEVPRNRALNGLLDALAAERPGVVSLPLARIVCPADPCPTTVDGIELRGKDGRHFDTPAAARWTAQRWAMLILGVDLDRT